MAVKDVIAQNKRAWRAAYEVCADVKGLRQPFGFRLHFIRQRDAKVRAITQDTLELGRVFGRRDDQNIPDPSQHQRAERIVDHRLVIDGQQLLAHRHGDRIASRRRVMRRRHFERDVFAGAGLDGKPGDLFRAVTALEAGLEAVRRLCREVDQLLLRAVVGHRDLVGVEERAHASEPAAVGERHVVQVEHALHHHELR